MSVRKDLQKIDEEILREPMKVAFNGAVIGWLPW